MKRLNKKGFTLIELLAVIVILAIIALIATPLVLSLINNAKEGSTLYLTRDYYGHEGARIILNKNYGVNFTP